MRSHTIGLYHVGLFEKKKVYLNNPRTFDQIRVNSILKIEEIENFGKNVRMLNKLKNYLSDINQFSLLTETGQ